MTQLVVIVTGTSSGIGDALGNPDFMSSEELAEIVLFCWKQPQSICIRDLVVAPTRTVF